MPDTLPRIAYDNAITSATLTASPSGTEADGPVMNLNDWLPWTFWRPTTAAVTVTADLGASKAINAVALAGHDATGAVTVETWNGSSWVAFASATAAGDGAVLYLTATSVTTTKVRVTFAALTFLAVWFAGTDITLPEGLAPGWTDPVLAQRAKTTTETTRGGVWLGNTVELWSASLDLSLKSVSDTWVRDTWMPLVRACSTRPFFLHWFADEWPNSACLCTNASFGGTAFSGRSFCDVSVSFDADSGYDRRLTP